MRIVSKTIASLKFCVSHKLSIQGHGKRDNFSNREIFLDFFVFLSNSSPSLRDHSADTILADIQLKQHIMSFWTVYMFS